MKKKLSLLLSVIICMLVLAACAGQSSEPEDKKEVQNKKEKVRVANWSQLISEQTNLLVDEEKKFFTNEGLSVEVIPGAGGGDAIKNILTGKADIAFTDPGSLFSALNKGEKLKVIYNIYPQNVFNVVSLKESNITKPEDLKGKKIGVYSLASGTRQNLLVLLHQAGLTEKDVTIVETGLLNFAPLMQGQVDATAATDTGLYLGKQKGLGEVNVMEVKDSLNFPSDFFVVTEETYEKKQDLLKSFLAGYEKSASWMIEHPEEAADLAVKHAIDGKDKENNLEIIKLRNASSVSELTDEKGLGFFDMNNIQEAADLYKKLGLIEKELNMSEIITEELVPKKQ
ncbi:ABC transporter substrate-binding protein [Metabacillus fastidiosus]|uniref:Thiamine pyrimidine synthase n=1 Tax=Metabacillus fastidiosus TaxID=1458 RepID=A0ABU6NS93_9BACI|nr:ABC transporter substrate-binding protein [Metabacillus fastidiosus]